jgi:hypothetical protein
LLLLSLGATGCYAEAVPWQATKAGLAEPLVARAGCTMWHGRLSGNDPNVVADLELCRLGDGDEVVGRVQYRSDASGHSIRELRGGFEPNGALVMKETRFERYEPELFWTFCLVDRYELQPRGDARLVGHYDSKSCHDHARIDLVRVR